MASIASSKPNSGVKRKTSTCQFARDKRRARDSFECQHEAPEEKKAKNDRPKGSRGFAKRFGSVFFSQATSALARRASRAQSPAYLYVTHIAIMPRCMLTFTHLSDVTLEGRTWTFKVFLGLWGQDKTTPIFSSFSLNLSLNSPIFLIFNKLTA